MKPAQELLSIAKPQNLKAIHNVERFWGWSVTVVINHKTTKFESNSQLDTHSFWFEIRCYQSQNYKIWKQFTTNLFLPALFCPMLSITKLQNLKAIHNPKRQFIGNHTDVINHKTTKFESNSQRETSCVISMNSCYQSQNYKIWKQFTTSFALSMPLVMLLSITKLQNLKAIHNAVLW